MLEGKVIFFGVNGPSRESFGGSDLKLEGTRSCLARLALGLICRKSVLNAKTVQY